jgi:hypothetical protein
MYMCADRVRGVTDCPSWNGIDLNAALLPPVLLAALEETAATAALEAAQSRLAAAAGAVADTEARYARLLALAEETDSPPAGIVERLTALEAELASRTAAKAQAAVALAEAGAVLDEQAIEDTIQGALAAVCDPALRAEREALRVRLLAAVERMAVWPKRQAAAVRLRAQPDAVLWLGTTPDAAAQLLQPGGQPELPPGF